MDMHLDTDGVIPQTIEMVLAGARARYERSTDFTLGVEEEYGILDPASLDLVPRFSTIEAAASAVGMGENVCGELLASEVEFRTGRCETFAEAVAWVHRIRAVAIAAARSEDLLLASAGTHPWADYRDQLIIDKPYYQTLVERLQYVARRNNTFGLHVHVGVRRADRAIRVADALRTWIPELLALSASSPYLDGVDTGLVSMRAMTFSRNFPRGNLPPAFGSWSAYEDLIRWYARAGSIDSYGQMWWGVRPHAIHGTIELRMFDAQPDVAGALALVALSQGLVAHLCDRLDAGDLDAPVPEHLIDDNHFRAVRWGTSARFVDLATGMARPVTDSLRELVSLARTAGRTHDLGIDEALDRVLHMIERGCEVLVFREAVQAADGDLPTGYRALVETTMTPVA